MNKKSVTLKHGTYRHYRRRADGTLLYLGEVAYAYPSESPCARTDAERAEELAWRDEAELERRAADAEAFENLADAACEQEG